MDRILSSNTLVNGDWYFNSDSTGENKMNNITPSTSNVVAG